MLGLKWIRDPRARYQNSNQCIVMSVVTEMDFFYLTVKFQIVEFSMGTCHFPHFHDRHIELL